MRRNSRPQVRRRCCVGLGVALLAGVTLFAADARASGAVSVETAGKHCSVVLQQTFRKILRRSSSGLYYGRIHREFRKRLAQVLPAVDAAVSKASRRQRALTPYDLRYRRRRCPVAGSCAPALRGPYPVLLAVPIKHRGDARNLFWVNLPLRRALSTKKLARLSKRLQALIERDGGDPKEGSSAPSAHRIPPQARKTPRIQLHVKTTRRAVLAAVPQLRAQLEDVAKRALALVQVTLKQAKGSPSFGPFVEGKKLPAYRIGNALPAMLSVNAGNGYTTISVQLVLTKLSDDKQRIAFLRDLEQKLSALLPR